MKGVIISVLCIPFFGFFFLFFLWLAFVGSERVRVASWLYVFLFLLAVRYYFAAVGLLTALHY
jgi:EamA domain-containing membrane protein RarD